MRTKTPTIGAVFIKHIKKGTNIMINMERTVHNRTFEKGTMNTNSSFDTSSSKFHRHYQM